MNLLNIIIIIIVGLFTLEILKHLFIKKIYKTGATIVDSASTLKDNFNFEEFKKGIFSEINKQKEATRKTLSKIQNN